MNNDDRLLSAQAQGISIYLPGHSAKLHRARAELRKIQERLSLDAPPNYIDRVIELCEALHPMDRRDAEAITLAPADILAPEER
jgi:hypothetical protein